MTFRATPRLVAGIIALPLLVVGGIVAARSLRDGASQRAPSVIVGGPLAYVTHLGQVVPAISSVVTEGTPATRGKAITWSNVVVENTGDAPAVLEKINLVRAGVLSDRLEVLGNRILALGPSGVQFIRQGFDQIGSPAEGYVIRSGERVILAIGLRPDRNGRLATNGVMLYYRVGKTQYQVILARYLVLCVGMSGVCN
jgi:hypothetical protein